MLYKSLVIGVLMSIGIFAVKSGAGIGYRMARQRRVREKIVVWLLFSGVYALLFGFAAAALHYLDPVRHLNAVQTFMQSGMIVHVGLAGVMAVWGMMLLKRAPSENTVSRGWLLLAAPCPVCVAVILFCAAFLVSLFPDHPLTVMSGLYAVFILISLLTIIAVGMDRKSSDHGGPESFLGSIMLLAAAYFILSVAIMPQFADLDKVYRLAGYASDAVNGDRRLIAPIVAVLTAAFLLGWGLAHRRIRAGALKQAPF